MIPSTSGFLERDFERGEQPTLTYKMNTNSQRLQGYAENLEAMKQAVYKILLTERYQYLAYSADYGIETVDLFGEPVSYVCPELERRIKEALLWDTRIESVDNFEFDTSKKGAVNASFVVHTVFGDIKTDKEVKV